MQYYRHHWYYTGAILFVALAYLTGFWGSSLEPIPVILIYSFMALLVHQCEEYAHPGGFPAIFNIAVLGEKEVPERYPLNANQALVINVFLAYPFYVAAIFLPGVIWLGLAQVLFGMFQIILHGIVINLRLKSLYNPGLASVVFLHIPIGIYYIWYVTKNGLASTVDFGVGLLVTIVAALVIIFLPLKLMASKDSRYPFLPKEMGGFAKEKVAKIRMS
ncbi:MAG: HXXEE domain-containing protein [Caldilineaceae bacterium]|jgi:hypothetical protein